MVKIEEELDKLQELIGYRFQDINHLKQSLTHRSYGAFNNERLEFLGDAILNCVIACALYDQFPEASEGQLSRLRSQMVRRSTLAEIAREFSIRNTMILGRGEMKSGGFDRESTLSDTMEAIIGAVFMDGGLELTRNQILIWYKSRMSELSLENSQIDAKSRLQEYLQGIGEELPQYSVVGSKGRSHEQMFTVECQSSLLRERAIGEGTSRRIAEQIAAGRALDILGITSKDTG
ncbi:MAG: ribonuclease III [Gammaproteobacteria bacterium]|nr:ribonuclease III [Gammaproteobacteria bacterium]